MTVSPELASPRSARKGRVPDFFIVGHAKCGTTALWEALRRHPQIYMPPQKEPWFFARDNPQPEGERSIEVTGKRSETLEEYMALFAAARPDQRVGEGSTSYLWSPVAARAIAGVQPEARIVAIVREPASFLCSLHLQLLSNNTESEKDFRRAIELEPLRREGRELPRYAFWPRTLMYSERVRYAEQLRRFHAVFPREQVRVLIYDDFRADNEGTVREVLRFLGVDETYPLGVADVNPTRRVRSVRLSHLTRMLQYGRGPVSGAVKPAVRRVLSTRARKAFLWPLHRRLVYGAPKPADEEFMLELRRRFKPEVEALSDYLGRDLVTQWGYDRLG
jgi:Sulfotransferase family